VEEGWHQYLIACTDFSTVDSVGFFSRMYGLLRKNYFPLTSTCYDMLSVALIFESETTVR
jgi:hypothetical protein